MTETTCSVDGCVSPMRGRGLCNKHLIRLRRHGDVEAYFPSATRWCAIEGCGAEHHARGWCIKHWNRWQSTGDPEGTRARVNPVMPGPTNPRWKGDAVGYAGVHLRMWRGDPAANYSCAHCPDAAQSWAYDHNDPDEKESDRGPYSVKREHYLPLCYSCHTRFDKGQAPRV